MIVNCTVCGKKALEMEHYFFSGLGAESKKNPDKEWSYFATLYHTMDEHLPFCSPECSTKYVVDKTTSVE